MVDLRSINIRITLIDYAVKEFGGFPDAHLHTNTLVIVIPLAQSIIVCLGCVLVEICRLDPLLQTAVYIVTKLRLWFDSSNISIFAKSNTKINTKREH